MIIKELQEYLDNHPNGKEIAVKAVDKLLRNKKAGEETQGDEITLCSSTCSKRGIYEIYTMMKLIELVRYEMDVNAKYFKVIDEDGLLKIKEEINKRKEEN